MIYLPSEFFKYLRSENERYLNTPFIPPIPHSITTTYYPKKHPSLNYPFPHQFIIRANSLLLLLFYILTEFNY